MRDWNSKKYRNSRYKEPPPAPGLRSRPFWGGHSYGPLDCRELSVVLYWWTLSQIHSPSYREACSLPGGTQSPYKTAPGREADGLWMLRVVELNSGEVVITAGPKALCSETAGGWVLEESAECSWLLAIGH